MKYFLFLISLSLLWTCQIPYRASDVFEEKASLAKDEAPHTKNSLEWWYFTGHLKDSIKQKELGVEFVVFHFNPTNIKGGWMINMAVSDPENNNFYFDYFYRTKSKHQFEDLPLNFNWEKRGRRGSLAGMAGNYQFAAQMKKHPVSFQLSTHAAKPLVMHNNNGYEKYGNYATAGYYSYPRLNTQGSIHLNSDTFNVKGELWYDRQWNCSGVWNKKIAWDWFSIQFEETESELMLYRVYHIKKQEGILGGTYTNKDGESTFLEPHQISIVEKDHWLSEESGATYPISWDISIPDLKLNTQVKTLFPNQELDLKMSILPHFYYWEGISEAQGNIAGQKVHGNSYVEMSNRFRMKKK